MDRESTLRVGQLRRSWIAARLAGVGSKDVPTWALENGLPTASLATFERAVGPIRASSPLKSDRGRPGKRRPKDAPRIWDWILVDERALDIDKVVLRISNDGTRRDELREQLGSLEGVRQVIECGSDRELIVVGLVRGRAEASELRARIEALSSDRAVRMDYVDWEDSSGAKATWAWLARPRTEGSDA